MKKILALSAGLLISGFALASNVQTSEVPLVGGNIAPKSTLVIKLNTLVANAPYQVTCTIQDPVHSTDKDVAIMAAYNTMGSNNVKFSLNGNKFTSVAYLSNKHKDNSFVASPVTSQSGMTANTLSISNLDNTAFLTVENCVAVPTTK